MRTILKLIFCSMVCSTQAFAQSPRVSARATAINASVGYSRLSLAIPLSDRVSLNGVEATMTADFFPHLGVKAELSYVRASNVANTGHHSDVLTYLAGPVFYPARYRNVGTYFQWLAGAARVTGATPAVGGGFFSGYVNKFSWAFGGGAEYQLSKSVALRVGVEALHIAYFNPSGAIQGQYDLRTTSSVVYVFGGRSKRRN
jgi:opacity protein-like surface antigen